MNVAVICVALLGLLLFGLGLAVSLQRRRTSTWFGYQDDPSSPLYKLVRAHGNTAEYVPMLSILILLAVQRNPASWVLDVVMIVTALRYIQVAALVGGSTMNTGANRLRFIGSLGTYICGALLCVAILLSV